MLNGKAFRKQESSQSDSATATASAPALSAHTRHNVSFQDGHTHENGTMPVRRPGSISSYKATATVSPDAMPWNGGQLLFDLRFTSHSSLGLAPQPCIEGPPWREPPSGLAGAQATFCAQGPFQSGTGAGEADGLHAAAVGGAALPGR